MKMATKEKWTKYTQSSTLHGLCPAFDQDRKLWRRILWLVLISAAFLFLVYTLSFGVSKLLYPEYMTQISVDQASSIPFPSVTFCPNNMYRKSYVENDPEVLAYIMKTALTDAQYLTDNKTLVAQANAVSLIDLDPEKLTRKLIEASHPASQTVLWSKAFGERVDSGQFAAELTSMGMCYTFNMSRDVKQGNSVNGLYVMSLVNSDDYFYNVKRFGALGTKVQPHGPGALPEVETRGIGAGPKAETMITMQKKVTYLLPETGCVAEGSNRLELYDTYSQSACINECTVKYQVDLCGCRYFYDPGNYTLCLTSKEFICLRSLSEDSHSTKSCDCPPKCVEETFECKVSGMPFPSQYKKDYDERKGNRGLTKNWDDRALMTIFFETLDVITIVEKRIYTSEDFLSDVGGLMGLWLGASVITWTEMLEALIDVLWSMCTQSKRLQGTNTNTIKIAPMDDEKY